MKTCAVYSRKGGVGKNTSTVNIAANLAAAGNRVLLVDFDPQGAATWYLRVDREEGSEKSRWRAKKINKRIVASDYENLDLLPADVGLAEAEAELAAMKRSKTQLAQLLEPLALEYDVCLIDCPPASGRVGSAIVKASDLIATPVVPTWLARRMLDELADEVSKKKLWPFASMVQRRAEHREQLQELRASKLGLAETAVPQCSKVELMGRHRQPVDVFAAKSPGGRAYAKLACELATALKLK